MRNLVLIIVLFCVVLGGATIALRERRSDAPVTPTATGELKTIYDRLAEFSEPVRQRFTPLFELARVNYPPSRMALVAIKETRKLELWAANESEDLRFIRDYDVLAASGQLGPKLREGDLQVPEGLYRIVLLNPNSLYHLSLRVSYPNPFDLKHAAEEGRTDPGTDIMIHGSDRSRGCLAMGDEAAEDLFVVAALTETREIPVVISPVDFRVRDFAAPADAPVWTQDLYREIQQALHGFQRTAEPTNLRAAETGTQ